MNRPELFKRSVDVLAKAYRDNELVHVDCTRCAVGNMLDGRGGWYDALMFHRGFPHTESTDALHSGYLEIQGSGYSIGEMDDIEDTFMKACVSYEDDNGIVDDYFEPLMAVVDVLLDVHDAHDEEAEARACFVIPEQVPA